MNRRSFGITLAAFAGFVLVFAGQAGLGQPPGGGFGKGPPGGQQRKIVKDFDTNKDGGLNKDERAAARDSLKNNAGGFGGGKGGFGGKLLAVPALRAKYLANVKTIAEKSLDWKVLGPIVSQYRLLMEKEVELDTRKLESLEAFKRATANEPEAGGGRGLTLRAFADQRRRFLIDYTEPKKAP